MNKLKFSISGLSVFLTLTFFFFSSDVLCCCLQGNEFVTDTSTVCRSFPASSVVVVLQANTVFSSLRCQQLPSFLLWILLLTILSSSPVLSFSQLYLSSSFLSHHYFLQWVRLTHSTKYQDFSIFHCPLFLYVAYWIGKMFLFI